MSITKNQQIEMLSEELGLHKSLVAETINDYLGYLKFRIRNEEPAPFLGIVEIRKTGTSYKWTETLAYQVGELLRGRGRGESFFDVAYRILIGYRDLLVRELIKGNRVVVVGLLSMEQRDGRLYTFSSEQLPKGVRTFALSSLKYEIGLAMESSELVGA